jgi:hypothetical protein
VKGLQKRWTAALRPWLHVLDAGRAVRGAVCAPELAPAAPSCDALAIVSIVPVNTLPTYFASFNIDSSRQRSFFDVNLSDTRLTYLASQISGTNIRFGGTGNDFIYYEVPSEPACPPTVPYVNECLNASLLAGLTTFATAARAGLIFGLSLLPFNNSYHPSPYPHPDAAWSWDSTNAAALLRHAKASGIQYVIAHRQLRNPAQLVTLTHKRLTHITRT